MFVPRSLELKKYLNLTPIIAVVGPRQSGKTTLLRQLSNNNPDFNYVSFDDPTALLSFDDSIDQFYQQYVANYNYTIIDEVGFGSNVGSKLKNLTDVRDASLIIASSSEIILSKEIISSLVGRVTILRLYPFSIDEYMNYLEIQLEYKLIKQKLDHHILYGGYPRVVITENMELKSKLLSDIIMTHIQKDIVLTFELQDEILALKLLKLLATQVSSLFVKSSITRDLDITRAKLDKFMTAYVKSSIVKLISPYYTNKRTELVKSPKLFFVDCGLRNAILDTYTIDGQVYENYVFSELLKLGFEPKYWRSKSKAEVDFVISIGRDIIPIEVKKGSPKISKSFRSFLQKYQPDTAYVIGDIDEPQEEMIGNKSVVKTNIMDLVRQLKQLKR